MAEVAADLKVFDTKYVYVEMTLNKEAKYDTVTGMFMGIVERNNETFVLIQSVKDTVAVLNTKFYGIMTIEALGAEYKNMAYLHNGADDQAMGLKVLKEYYDLLLQNGFGMKNDTKIIDVDRYTDVPSEYKTPATVDYAKSVTGAASTNGATAATTVYGTGTTKTPYAAATTTYYAAAKKDPQPATFGRSKTKKPTKTELDLMQEKIDQIKAGTFVFELPETVCGEVKEVAKEANVGFYGDIDGYYG